jgi:hypothetical protein
MPVTVWSTWIWSPAAKPLIAAVGIAASTSVALGPSNRIAALSTTPRPSVLPAVSTSRPVPLMVGLLA